MSGSIADPDAPECAPGGHRSGRGGGRHLLLLTGLLGALPASWSGTATFAHGDGYRVESVASMTVPRSNHTATRLQDGRVLIAGGSPFPDFVQVSSAEIYDPSTRSFARTGGMHIPRLQHGAALLPDGNVLIAGGWRRQFAIATETAEIFDPQTGSFRLIGPMSRPQADVPRALPVVGGLVVVLAGHEEGDFGTSTAAVEAFDPGLGTFLGPGELRLARRNVAMCPLSDGSLLVAGGSYRCCAHPGNRLREGTYERYWPLTRSSSPVVDAPLWLAHASSSAVLPGGGCAVLLSSDLLFRLGDAGGRVWFDSLPDSQRGQYETLTPLAGDRLLITGSSVWVYDLERCEMELVDPRTAPDGHTATLLADGCVLVAGGAAAPVRATSEAFLVCPPSPNQGVDSPSPVSGVRPPRSH